MQITYANVPLLPPDPRMQAAMERYWRPGEEWQHPGYNSTGIGHLPYPTIPPSVQCPRLGVLHWPTGASRWATFHQLADEDLVAKIRTAVGSGNSPQTFTMSDAPGTIETELYLLPLRVLVSFKPAPLPTGPAPDQKLYLVTLVDKRYFWWMRGNEKLDTTPASWSALFNDLYTKLGETTPTVDTVPTGYSAPTDRWKVHYQPLPLLLDAAALTVGMRVVRLLNGDNKVVRYSTAKTAIDPQIANNESRRVFGGRVASTDLARAIPASVSVIFYGDTPSDDTRTLASLALTEYSGLTAQSGFTGQVWADMATTAVSGDKTAYADEAAKDWYRWRLADIEATYAGVVPWEPSGLEEAVEWGWEGGRAATCISRPAVADPNVYGGTQAAGASPPPPPPASASCYDCGWLRDKTALESKAFKLTVPEALGRCGCIDTGQGGGTGTEQFLLCYDADEDAWIGTRQFETCCGCGVIKLTLNEAATRLIDVPVFTLTASNGCTSMASFTLILDLGCCTRDEQGNPSATFVGYGPNACDPDASLPVPPDCENLFRVKLECVAEDCESSVRCDCKLCARCCEEHNGVTRWKVDGSGFAGGDCASYVGIHHLVGGSGCVWSKDGGCDGDVQAGVRMEYIENADPSLEVVRLTFSGSGPTEVYEIQANSFTCCASNILTRKAPQQCTVSPATVTVEPVYCGSSGCCTEATCLACTTDLCVHAAAVLGTDDPGAATGSASESNLGYGCQWTYNTVELDTTTICLSITGLLEYNVEVFCWNKTQWKFRVTENQASIPQNLVVGEGDLVVWSLSPFLASACYTPPSGGAPTGACLSPGTQTHIIVYGGSAPCPTVPTIPGGNPCGPNSACTPPGGVMMANANQAMRAVLVATPTTGPGTGMRTLLSDLGFESEASCGCKSLQAEMNRWGVEGCRERRDEIAKRLRENRAKIGWFDQVKAAARAVASGLAFRINPADVAGSLVDEAIRRAELQARTPTDDRSAAT